VLCWCSGAGACPPTKHRPHRPRVPANLYPTPSQNRCEIAKQRICADATGYWPALPLAC
jgi:hypothetical protein